MMDELKAKCGWSIIGPKSTKIESLLYSSLLRWLLKIYDLSTPTNVSDAPLDAFYPMYYFKVRFQNGIFWNTTKRIERIELICVQRDECDISLRFYSKKNYWDFSLQHASMALRNRLYYAYFEKVLRDGNFITDSSCEFITNCHCSFGVTKAIEYFCLNSDKKEYRVEFPTSILGDSVNCSGYKPGQKVCLMVSTITKLTPFSFCDSFYRILTQDGRVFFFYYRDIWNFEDAKEDIQRSLQLMQY